MNRAVHMFAAQANVTSLSAYTRVGAVTDNVIANLAGDGFMFERPVHLLAAYAGSTNLRRARIVIGSNLLAPAFVRPASATTTPGGNPNVMDLTRDPVLIPKGIEVGAEAFIVTAAADVSVVMLVAECLAPPPPGEAIWLRYTLSAAITPVANAWSGDVAMTSEKSLPDGEYAVIGLDGFATTGNPVAFRLIFQNQPQRPGGLLTAAATNRSHELFYNGSLGVVGTFPAFTPPRLEVLCTSTTAVTPEIYLRVVPLNPRGSSATMSKPFDGGAQSGSVSVVSYEKAGMGKAEVTLASLSAGEARSSGPAAREPAPLSYQRVSTSVPESKG